MGSWLLNSVAWFGEGIYGGHDETRAPRLSKHLTPFAKATGGGVMLKRAVRIWTPAWQGLCNGTYREERREKSGEGLDKRE